MSPDLLAAFQRGEFPIVCQIVDGRLRAGGQIPAALLCGSFNPLHAAHRELAVVAGQKLGVPVEFELTVVNADKPALSAGEIRFRLAQFVRVAPVWLTRAPTFAEKARLFPGVTFVVGADTAERVLSRRFYGDSADELCSSLGGIRAAGCRFLVAGRGDADGRFLAADAVTIPTAFRDIFDFLSESEFRRHVSSTSIRAQSQ